jgi:hypothetical protein
VREGAGLLPSDAHVRNVRVALFVEEDVVGLDIAMRDVLATEVFHCFCHLDIGPNTSRACHSMRSHELSQRVRHATQNQLQNRRSRQRMNYAKSVERHDAWMLQTTQNSDLADDQVKMRRLQRSIQRNLLHSHIDERRSDNRCRSFRMGWRRPRRMSTYTENATVNGSRSSLAQQALAIHDDLVFMQENVGEFRADPSFEAMDLCLRHSRRHDLV